MGLFKVIDDSCSQIALWRVTESEQELKDLTGLDLSGGSSSVTRRVEQMVVRAMLNQLSHLDPILYHPNGRPYYAKGTPHLSISHTAKMVAVGFSQRMSIGVDVERVNRDFRKVASRYLTKDELNWICLDHQKSLALAWCIKESVYKLPWEAAKRYTSDINIVDFKELAINGTVNVDVIDCDLVYHLELKYLFFDEFCLTWVLSDYRPKAD